jgi:GNAT superfamily N-acetyltransferase
VSSRKDGIDAAYCQLDTLPVTHSSGPIRIARATERDVPLILQLIRELAEYERAPDAAIATVEILTETLFGERPAAEVLIAYLDDEPAGFALFFHNFSTWLGRRGIYLEDIFVRPPARRNGVGEALFREIAAIAVERGCGRVEWAVLNWNELAISFYRRIGAVAKDDWTTFRLQGEPLAKLAGNSPVETGARSPR